MIHCGLAVRIGPDVEVVSRIGPMDGEPDSLPAVSAADGQAD